MRRLVKIAILVVLASYFSYAPAPENSPSPWVSAISISIVRFFFQLAAHLRTFSPDAEITVLRAMMAPTPCIDSVDENVIELDNFSIHVFTPKSYTGLHGAIIAIHGGGWVLGDVLSVRRLYSNIADEAGTVVVAPDYRLAPENVYDAGIEDCLETVKYVFDHADELNIDRNKIVLTGESAGGHLTLVTALGLVGTEYTLKGILPVYPATQGASVQMRSYFASDRYLLSRPTMGYFFSQWLTGTVDNVDDWLSGKIFNAVLTRSPQLKVTLALDEQNVPTPQEELVTTDEFIHLITQIMDYRVSPLFAPLDMLIDLPKTFIYVSEHDVLKDDGVLMYKQMLDIGHDNVKLIEWKGAVHGQLAVSEQSTGANMVPKATVWASAYIKRMKIMTD